MSDAAVQLSPGDWPAPLAPASSEAAGKNALVHIPGSKSLTNRYLLLAALADSPSVFACAAAFARFGADD